MSKLDRMNIMGLRSYGTEDNDVQGIEFDTPLTVIQGQNGCGKTTIIEAIKFAITGELPKSGSSRGHGFVYDPKLSKSTESIGRVKLRVIDAKGNYVSVFKAVRTTVKNPLKVEFKRLDSTISRGKGKEVVQTSNRCADVDQEMCYVLGVSKAIINQVLLCHQEDANWPMEEAKKLKERFDEIFDAAKYNKCQEHILKKIKDRMDKLKIMKCKVEGLLDGKKFVEGRKLSLHDKKVKYNDLTENVAEITAQLKPINERINELYKIEQNFAKLYTNIELKKKDLEYLEQQKSDILETLKLFNGSDAELKEKMSKFENDLKAYEDDIVQLKKKKQQCEIEEKSLTQKINIQENKLGSLQSEMSHNDKNTSERNHLIVSASNDVGLKTNDISGATPEERVISTIDALKKCFEKNKAQIVTKQTSMENEEEQIQIEIDLAREQNAQLEQKIKSKKRQLQELEDEMRTIKHKLEELDTADDQLKLSENKLQRVENDIKSLESSLDTDKMKQQIEGEKKKLKELQERNIVVENEIRELQQYTNIQTELDVKNENLLSKQNELKKRMNKHERSLMQIFDDNIPKSNLKNTIQTYIQDKRNMIKNLRNEIDDKQKDVLKLDNSLKSCKEKLNDKIQELSENKDKIKEHCDEGELLDNEIDRISNKLKHLHDKRGSLASSTYLYKNFIKKFQEDKPCCPLCKRDVDEKSAIKQIIDDIQKQIRNIPNELSTLDKELSTQQKKQEKLLSLQPLAEKNVKLEEDEIPTLQSQVESDQKQYEENVEQLKKLKTELSELQNLFDTSNGMFGDVCLMDQCQKEIISLKQQITILEGRMPSSSSSSGFQDKRGIDEAMTERESLNIDTRTVQNNIESHQTKLSQHTERLHIRREQKNQLLCQQLTIKKNLQDKDHLVTKSIEIDDKVILYSVNITELQTQTEPMKDALNTHIKNKSDLKTKNQQLLDQLRTKLSNDQKKLTQIVSLQTQIEKFNASNIMQETETAVNEISQYKKDIEVYSTKKTKIQSAIDEFTHQVTNSEMYYRELQDNIKLRETETKYDNLKREIETEERNIGKKDIKQIRKEKEELMDKCDTLIQQKHRKEGEKTQLADAIKEIKTELALPKHVKVSEEYRRKHMESLVLESIIVDLKEFSKAMDWSLMQYHKKRMVYVNSCIKELWRKVYKGNDIDYIEIKTDDMPEKFAEKRRLYTYRVIQVKNGIPLDMRGRCSAGQRVLASIIIRIALAETFSHNCGILALDEPTTNLDRENINSLADALLELIQHKRQQNHFQLLIITHDKDFVDRLTQMETLDRYYEIKRNDVGKSVINVHEMY